MQAKRIISIALVVLSIFSFSSVVSADFSTNDIGIPKVYLNGVPLSTEAPSIIAEEMHLILSESTARAVVNFERLREEHGDDQSFVDIENAFYELSKAASDYLVDIRAYELLQATGESNGYTITDITVKKDRFAFTINSSDSLPAYKREYRYTCLPGSGYFLCKGNGLYGGAPLESRIEMLRRGDILYFQDANITENRYCRVMADNKGFRLAIFYVKNGSEIPLLAENTKSIFASWKSFSKGANTNIVISFLNISGNYATQTIEFK